MKEYEMNSKSPKSFWAALAAFLLVPVSLANAADYELPAPDAKHNWEGFYAGVGVSAQGSGLEFKDLGDSGELEDDNGRAGVSAIAGYNHMSGNWLLGLEGSVGSVGLDETAAIAGLGNVNAQSDWFVTMQVRGGYAFDDLLVYTTAGLVRQDLEMSSSLGGKYDKALTGGVFGIGAEYAMSESLAVRAEVLGMAYNDDARLNGAKRKFDFGHGQIRVGVTHKF